jgi:hypothetical protein
MPKIDVVLPTKELAEAYGAATKITRDPLLLKFHNSREYFADALCKTVAFLGQSQGAFRAQLESHGQSAGVGLELLRIVMSRIQEMGPPGKLEELQTTYKGKEAAHELMRAFMETHQSEPPQVL